MLMVTLLLLLNTADHDPSEFLVSTSLPSFPSPGLVSGSGSVTNCVIVTHLPSHSISSPPRGHIQTLMRHVPPLIQLCVHL